MWREPEYQSIKELDRKRVLQLHTQPTTYIDMLSIIEHPAFLQFYEHLFAEGLAVEDTGEAGEGGSTGDLIKVGLREDYEPFDFEWPMIVREAEEELEDVEIDVKERNVFNVRINADGYLALYRHGNYDFIALEDLRAQAKEFIDNPHNLGSLPEKHVKDIELLGPMAVTENHVISVQTDRGTPYNIYFQVQNELVAAYNELRDELSMARFHKPYAALDEEHKVAFRATLSS